MAKTLRLILCSLLLSSAAYSQVVVDVDERINEELRMKNAQIDTSKISGFRIQIAFSADLSVVNDAKQKFRSQFPKMASESYTSYQQPYWKLRVGNYYREIDAQESLVAIRKRFSDAFVVRDYIKLPKLD